MKKKSEERHSKAGSHKIRSHEENTEYAGNPVT